MVANKNIAVVTFCISCFFLITLFYFEQTDKLFNVFLGLFTGSIVASVISFTSSLIERFRFIDEAFIDFVGMNSYLIQAKVALYKITNNQTSKISVSEIRECLHDPHQFLFKAYCLDSENDKVMNLTIFRPAFKTCLNIKFKQVKLIFFNLLNGSELDDSFQIIDQLRNSINETCTFSNNLIRNCFDDGIAEPFLKKEILKLTHELEQIISKLKKELKILHKYSGNDRAWSEIELVLYKHYHNDGTEKAPIDSEQAVMCYRRLEALNKPLNKYEKEMRKVSLRKQISRVNWSIVRDDIFSTIQMFLNKNSDVLSNFYVEKNIECDDGETGFWGYQSIQVRQRFDFTGTGQWTTDNGSKLLNYHKEYGITLDINHCQTGRIQVFLTPRECDISSRKHDPLLLFYTDDPLTLNKNKIIKFLEVTLFCSYATSINRRLSSFDKMKLFKLELASSIRKKSTSSYIYEALVNGVSTVTAIVFGLATTYLAWLTLEATIKSLG